MHINISGGNLIGCLHLFVDAIKEIDVAVIKF